MTTEVAEPTTQQAEWIAKRNKVELRSLRLMALTLLASIAAVASSIITLEMKQLWELGEPNSYETWLYFDLGLLALVLILLVSEYVITHRGRKNLGKYPTSEGGLEKPKVQAKIQISGAIILTVTVGFILWTVTLSSALGY